MSGAERDERLRLPDGRILAWRETGPVTGRPVLHFHGSASCRLEPAPAASFLERAGVRLLQPDRPGYGDSSPQPDRTLASWAADMETLCGHLGVARAAVSGWSAGALHALACAAHRPSVFVAAALVAAPGPLAAREAREDLPRDCRWAIDRAERTPAAARLAFAGAARLLRIWPQLSRRWLEKLLPPLDRASLAGAAIRVQWHEMVRQAWRQGAAGTWGDGLILTSPWDFDPAGLRVPVRLWHGSEDRLTPLSMAEALAERLPTSRLVRLPEEGHAAWLRHGEEILSDLVAAAEWGEDPTRAG